MREIKLQRLSLRDFQGGTFNLDIQSKDAHIFGENTSGKTRLVSAFTWLLFSKDALGRADFEIKNLDSTGEAVHGLEHSVEGALSIGGKITTLKKNFKEKWTKKRGNVEREFSGHTTEYFIDGVPLQEKEYNFMISKIAGDESRFRLLTSPTVFPNLHWQKQRGLLLEICGDISDQDIIASNSKLEPLTSILGKRTLDDHRKVVMARRTEINKELEKIPIRIDEVHRSQPDITGIDRKASEMAVQHLENALGDAKMRHQGVDTGGNIATLSKTLFGLNADLRKMEEFHRSRSLETLNKLNHEVSEVEMKITVLKRREVSIAGDLKQKKGRIQTMDAELSRLRTQWSVVDTEIFQDSVADTCPACGQALPSEQVQEAREKALAVFNDRKADRSGEINRKGKDLREQKDQLQREIEVLKKEATEIAPDRESKLKALIEERDVLKHSSENFSNVLGYDVILKQIVEIEVQIKTEREGKAQDIEKIRNEIAVLQSELTAAKEKIDLFIRRKQGEKRIEELKAEEKKLSAEFERLEGEIYLMELFIKTKVTMLTEKINEKFETVRFKLFNILINGGIEDTCQITVNGVPFDSGLNNGARINAGLEIVKVLQQHYQLKAPVFADNAEAVNKLVEVGCQMIRLYVSDDKVLRVEIAK